MIGSHTKGEFSLSASRNYVTRHGIIQ